MTLATAVRIESVLESNIHLVPLVVGVDNDSADLGGMTEAAQIISAEIDALTAQLAEARAEVERLRPAAEAWEAFMLCRDTRRAHKKAPFFGILDQTFETWHSARAAFRAVYKAVCRARAAKERKP